MSMTGLVTPAPPANTSPSPQWPANQQPLAQPPANIPPPPPQVCVPPPANEQSSMPHDARIAFTEKWFPEAMTAHVSSAKRQVSQSYGNRQDDAMYA